MRDMDVLDNLEFSRARPWRPSNAGVAVVLVGAIGLLAAGVLIGVFVAGL